MNLTSVYCLSLTLGTVHRSRELDQKTLNYITIGECHCPFCPELKNKQKIGQNGHRIGQIGHIRVDQNTPSTGENL